MFLDFIDHNRNRIVHLSALCILIAGLGYSFYLGNSLRFHDPVRYYAVAVNLANGNGYSLDGNNPTAYFTPGYTLLLALFAKFGASIIFLRYLNFIILSISIYVVRSILINSNAKAGAPFSAVLLIGYGVLFYTAGTLYPQTLFTLILLLLLRLAIVLRFTWWHAVLLGILSASLIMVHASGVFIPPLIVLWLIFPRNWNMIGKGLVGALVAVTCVAPWTYRNYVAFDKFMPVTSHGADTLYIGNNPQTSISEWYDYVNHDAYREACKLPEEEQGRYFFQQVKQFWTNQPADGIRLYLSKLVYYFNFRNQYKTSGEASRAKEVVLFITYYPLLLCLGIRLFFVRKIPLSRIETLLVAMYLGSALFYAIFIPRIRFRLPYDVVLITHIGIMFSLARDYISLPVNKRER